MIRMMRINNVDSFLKMTDEMRGDMLLRLPNGTECSLKNDQTAREMLKVMPIRDGEIDVQLTNKDDLPRVLYYMMSECA